MLADAFGALSLRQADEEELVLLTIESTSPDVVVLSIRPRPGGAEQTAVVYDERMCAHRSPCGDHPERPERISTLYNGLVNGGLSAHCVSVPSRLVTRAEVELVHEQHLWDKMEWAVQQEVTGLNAFAAQHESLFLNSSSLEAARCAAGSVLQLTEAVVSGRVRNGMAIVRPPGHHAEAHTAMGFCVFNTVAIAAQHARATLGCRRVLVVDWDIHHGNGIQRIFEADPSVLYFSIHRYERGQFFPSSPDAAPQSVGRDAGSGTSVNVAWNTRGHARPGDAEYLTAWREVLMPIAREFDPDLVIVAAGFDAAEGDPLGACHVTPAGYGALTRELATLANGRLVIALEGGYSLSATAVSAAACMEALLGLPAEPVASLAAISAPAPALSPPMPRTSTLKKRAAPPARFRLAQAAQQKQIDKDKENQGGEPCDRSARRAIEETKAVHASYWKCLRKGAQSHSEPPPSAPTEEAAALVLAGAGVVSNEGSAPIGETDALVSQMQAVTITLAAGGAEAASAAGAKPSCH